jgi:hypothetical protein
MVYKFKLQCVCGEEIFFENEEIRYSAETAEKLTGWTVSRDIINHKSIWFCPECAKKLKELFLQFVQITNNQYCDWTVFNKNKE